MEIDFYESRFLIYFTILVWKRFVDSFTLTFFCRLTFIEAKKFFSKKCPKPTFQCNIILMLTFLLIISVFHIWSASLSPKLSSHLKSSFFGNFNWSIKKLDEWDRTEAPTILWKLRRSLSNHSVPIDVKNIIICRYYGFQISSLFLIG